MRNSMLLPVIWQRGMNETQPSNDVKKRAVVGAPPATSAPAARAPHPRRLGCGSLIALSVESRMARPPDRAAIDVTMSEGIDGLTCEASSQWGGGRAHGLE